MTESSGLPPEQEAVRRLLADARHDGPPPPEVVARLDDTLASLVAERTSARTTEPTTAPLAAPPTEHDDRSPGRVVDLGSRRRRVASIGLLAAASVVVAGVAIGQALPRSGGDDSSASSAGSASSDSSLADTPTSEDHAGAGADGGGDAGSESGLSEPDPRGKVLEPGLGRPTLFSDDDEDLAGQLLELRPDATSDRQRLRSLAALRGCEDVDPGRSAAAVSATVDEERGLVVFRPPVGAEQVVELYVCGRADPVRTITLPAP